MEDISVAPPEVREGENPWKKLGPSASETTPSPRKIEPEKPSNDDMQKMKDFLDAFRTKEKPSTTVLEISIDKDKLAQTPIPRRKRPSWEEGSEEEGVRELEAMIENFGRLPERMSFQPGITLIVGENGQGKTTLAKALYVALERQDIIDDRRMWGAMLKDIEQFNDAEGTGDRTVFEPSVGNPSFIWNRQAGLAPQIAKTIRVENVARGKRNPATTYKDFPELIGERRGLEWKWKEMDMVKGGEEDWWTTGENMDYRSHRQTVDRFIFDEIRRESGFDTDPNIYFFDEPETGMSPRRHAQLDQELQEVTPKGSMIIVPTNSVYLYQTDLPRIDLEHPERGVHRPSEYPQTPGEQQAA